MRSLVLVTVLVAAAAGGVLYQLSSPEAEATGRSGRPQEVQSVAIGGRNLPIAALRAVLSTKIGEQLDLAKLATDRDALEAALVARGYLDAKVAPAEIIYDANKAAFVVFEVRHSGIFHVRSVRVTGASAKDAGVVTLATGEVALDARIQRSRDALADRLHARGKASVVVAKLSSDEQNRAVDVELVAR